MAPGRWLRAFRTPVGIVAALLMGVVLVMAVIAPLVWGEAASAIDTS